MIATRIKGRLWRGLKKIFHFNLKLFQIFILALILSNYKDKKKLSRIGLNGRKRFKTNEKITKTLSWSFNKVNVKTLKLIASIAFALYN